MKKRIASKIKENLETAMDQRHREPGTAWKLRRCTIIIPVIGLKDTEYE
jgi:hypothetical protein